ncbi:hypothetical protein EI94DRAFT_1746095 [Lactarius quietus]|nr:hypothetical protein EI94DRAFT_1746095 [Lactarius quietus]
MSAFVWELVWIFKAAFGRLRGKAEPGVSTETQHEKSNRAHQPSSVRTADLYERKQRDTLLLLLCMAFLLASLSSFFSLLDFNPNGSGAVCTFVVALSAIASQVARVFGLLILGLNLRHQISGLWELWAFWSSLALATALNGVTIGLGSGQLVTPLIPPRTALCFRKRFLPTSLVGSVLNIVLELYILIRIMSLMKPPRLQYATIQDTLLVQAGSLLFFDLLVFVPEAILTGLMAEFFPFSIGALTILVAFHNPCGQSTSHPTQLDGPDLASRSPMVSPEPPILQGDTPNRLSHIDSPPASAIAFAIHDIEAATGMSLSPRAAPRRSSLPNEVLWETNLVSPAQTVEVSVQTKMASDVSPVTQLDAGNLPRKQKIVSYSNPVWATLGALQQNHTGGPSHPQIMIEFTRSPTSSNPSLEQGSRVHPSPSSTILGSDIIRVTASHFGRDRMRIRHSVPSSALSPTSPIPSSWQRATYQSRAENASQSSSKLPKETIQPLGPTSSRSYKSRRESKSSRSSRSSKSSIRSAKVAVLSTGEGSLRRSGVFMAPMSLRQSSSFPVRTRHTRPVGVVRGPRPSPSVSRIEVERS